MNKHYFEFQCLGCYTSWLMEGKKTDNGLEKPIPMYCPTCGTKFEEVVSAEIVFAGTRASAWRWHKEEIMSSFVEVESKQFVFVEGATTITKRYSSLLRKDKS